MNRMTSLTVGGETKTFRYNPRSEIIERIYPSGRITTYTFNHAGQITEARELCQARFTLRRTTFMYLENGLLRSETRTGIDVGLIDETQWFYFDGSGRLTRTRVEGGGINTFEYDIAGNLTREIRDGVVISYTYNAQNQMTSKNKVGEITNFTYDNRGNLISQTSSAGTRTFEYDSRGRLVFGENERGETTEYRYNALGARIFNEQVRFNWNRWHQNAPHFRGSWEESDTLDFILRENRNVWQRIWETNVAGTVVQNNKETVTKHYLPDYTSWALRDIDLAPELQTK